jgi:N-acetyl sugar amidotransferase
MILQTCTKCLMDTSDAGITFDSNGICNHCRDAERELPKYKFTTIQENDNLKLIGTTIKAEQTGNYHAIIGLSGGVDSSFVTHLAKQMDLNPLIVHFDNGWNSEKSVSNIKKLIDKCGFHLETLVINWPEFKDLQRSFFRAGVVDIEILTDHAIMATLFKLRKKHNIKFVLSGANYATEHGMPSSWLWRKQDWANIKAIQKKFGTKPLNEFPKMSTVEFQMMKLFNLGGVYVEPLDRINYSKSKAIEILQKEYEWEYYGGKHYESVFTKFYQAYVLPNKFGYDKRKVHLSALVRNGEITLESARVELAKPLYDQLELTADRDFILKKLGFSLSEFDQIMKEKPKSHLDYGSDEWIYSTWNNSIPTFIKNVVKKVVVKK